MPPNIRFIYTSKPESAERLKLVYDRIFMAARQNIIQRKLNQKGGEQQNEKVFRLL
jgi:hypothetical protein